MLQLAHCLVLVLVMFVTCQAVPYTKRFQSRVKVFHDEAQSRYEAAWQPASGDQQKVDEKVMAKASGTKDEKESAKEANTKTWMYWNSVTTSPEKKLEPFAGISDPCEGIYCHPGRVCQLNADGKGECVCGDDALCQGRHSIVCGTDGVFYPSHCELHRVACLKKVHISIDDSRRHCQLANDKQQISSGNLKSEEATLIVKENSLADDNATSINDDVKLGDDAEKDENTKASKASRVKGEPVKEKSTCSKHEFGELKKLLLQYHCSRIGSKDCSDKSLRKPFLLDIMFHYYDVNGDERIQKPEVLSASQRAQHDKLTRFCHTSDLFTFHDTNADDIITRLEFYAAFNTHSVTLAEDHRVFTSYVTEGSSVELKCEIKGATQIIWKRNGALLDETAAKDIRVFADGSLYLTNVAVHLSSNYTCEDVSDSDIVQTHVVHVQMAPRVQVTPLSQSKTSGATVILKCRATGIPRPKVTWQFNESPVDSGDNKHYLLLNSNSTLEIIHAAYNHDTGAYKCEAKNVVGTRIGVATVVVQNEKTAYSSSRLPRQTFAVFHDEGYTMYDPSSCYLAHMVDAKFDEYARHSVGSGPLCAPNTPCSWGAAVNVKDMFIYVTQPLLNRVVVIDVTKHSNPVEVIKTDERPVSIHYVERLDQVWVVCWNEEQNGHAKTAVVIRKASRDVRHEIIHTKPLTNQYDLLKDLFLPTKNDLNDPLVYGYAVRNEQEALYKLDLQAMEYVNKIDLKPYYCVPKSVTFVPLGGRVIVTCDAPTGENPKTSHLTLDYVTDRVLEHVAVGDSAAIIRPFVSPDVQYVVNVVDDDTLVVNKVNDDGILTRRFDEITSMKIADATFFPSPRGHSYNFYASSADRNSVLFVDLESGKVQNIGGVGYPPKPSQLFGGTTTRSIVGGGTFGDYLMLPSDGAIVVIDGRRQHVQCEWSKLKNIKAIVSFQPAA